MHTVKIALDVMLLSLLPLSTMITFIQVADAYSTTRTNEDLYLRHRV